MQALNEQLTENERKYFTVDGLFSIPAYVDYLRFLDSWGLTIEAPRYEEIDDARYIEAGHYDRD